MIRFMMIRFILIVIGVALMIGFCLLFRWFFDSVPVLFGDGFCLGMIFETFLLYVVWKGSPEAFLPRR
jgi:hypothetical protein